LRCQTSGKEGESEANSAVNSPQLPPQATPPSETPRPGPSLTKGAVDPVARQTLFTAVVAQLTQASAIKEGEIATQPAAAVLAQRLADITGPELVLLAHYVMGQAQAAPTAWVVAVRVEAEAMPGSAESARPVDAADTPEAADPPRACRDDLPTPAARTHRVPPPPAGSAAPDHIPFDLAHPTTTGLTAARADRVDGIPTGIDLREAATSALHGGLLHERGPEDHGWEPPSSTLGAGRDGSVRREGREPGSLRVDVRPPPAKLSRAATAPLPGRREPGEPPPAHPHDDGEVRRLSGWEPRPSQAPGSPGGAC